LLLGRLLENLKAADQQPTGDKLDVSAIAALITALEDEEDSDGAEPGGSSVEVSGPVLKDPFADWAPRAGHFNSWFILADPGHAPGRRKSRFDRGRS